MSFGDGNLHIENEELKEQLHLAKRQLGGLTAAHNRLKGESRTLKADNERLLDVNGALCAEVNEKGRRIAQLECERDALAADLADAMARIDALEAIADEMFSMLREAATASNVDEVVEIKRRLAAVKTGVMTNG